MDYKPSELFIGLVEFISVILPGSLFTAILLGIDASNPIYNDTELFNYYKDDTSVVFWVAFIFVSFGVGYFLNSIASGLDWFFDKIRIELFPYKIDILKKIMNSEKEYKNSLEKAETLFKDYFEEYKSNIFRKTGHFFFETEPEVFTDGIKIEKSYEAAFPLKIKHLIESSDAINVYKWSQAILDTYFPAVAEQVNRSMAVSKFFRSLVLVSFLFIIFRLAGWLPDTIPWWPGVVLLILSFREYVVQRQKSIQAAYKGIVTLFHTSENLKIIAEDSGEGKSKS